MRAKFNNKNTLPFIYNAKFLVTISLFSLLFSFVSCSSTDPFIDPGRKGADLPEVFFSKDFSDNLMYSQLKFQEAYELKNQENIDNEKILQKLLEAASYVRIAIKQARMDVSIETQEYYQDLLMQISSYYPDSTTGNIFIKRLLHEYDIFSKDDKTDANIQYLYARALYISQDADNISQAVHVCSNLIKRLDKEHYESWLLIAKILFDYEDFETALLYFKHAFQVRTNINNTEALKHIAVTYDALGLYSEAISSLKNYIDFTSIENLTLDDYEYYASLHVKIGQLVEAENILQNDVPRILAAIEKCKHFKMLGIIELELAKKLGETNSSSNDVELEKEKVLMVRSAKFAFELYLRFHPDDQIAINLLDQLKAEYKIN